MIKIKKEAELFSLLLVLLVVGFFNLIFLVSCTIDKSEVKYIIQPNNQVSVLLEIPHLTLKSTETEKEIQEEIKNCHFYESYLKSIVLDKTSPYYKENLNNIKKEIENVQQTEGMYYARYRDLVIKKDKARQEKKLSETTTTPSTTKPKEQTTKPKETTTTQPSTTKPTTTQPTTTKPATTQYSVASTIWTYLKNQGYNNYVCAGIMGNIMAEVGGHTLDIDYRLYDDSGKYYGICQWSNKYHSAVQGASLNGQLSYLIKTIQNEIDNYGYLYSSDFDYTDFKNMTDASDAALAFAKTYERCGSGSYSKRQANADKAYNYFVR